MIFLKKTNSLLACAIAMALTGCHDDDLRNKGQIPTPRINAGADLQANENTWVDLSATVSDGREYEWQQISGTPVNLHNITTNDRNIRFQLPEVPKTETLVFRFSAENSTGSAHDDVTITVTNVPIAPVANAGAHAEGIEGKTITLNGSATVPATEPAINYQWTQIAGPSAQILQGDQAALKFIAPEVTTPTDLTFRLVATSDIASAPSDVTVTIKNSAPTPLAGNTIEVFEGEAFTLDGSGSIKNENTPIESFTWRSVDAAYTIDNSSLTNPKRTLIAKGVDADTDYQFGLVVADPAGTSEEALVTVRVKNGGDTPVAIAADVIAPQKTKVTVDASASSDPKNRALSYAWTQVLAEGETAIAFTEVNGGSSITFDAPEVAADKTFTFTLVAYNGVNYSAPETVKVTINKSPVAVAGTLIEVLEGESFTLDGAASYINGDAPITGYTWRSLNANYAVDNTNATAATRTLNAKGVDAQTDYPFGLVVQSADGTSQESTVTVRVKNGGDTPIAIANDVSVLQNSAASLSASPSTEPKNRPLTFMWEQVLVGDEASVDFTLEDGGSRIKFKAPATEENTQLTFNVIAYNGINYSAPTLVTVNVVTKEVYTGNHVELKGNPYTTLGQALDLGFSAYSIEVVGTKAYITYHERQKNEAGIQPTGLLVVDISDERNPKIENNFPITWAGAENAKAVQMRLAVDSEGKYAYVVDSALAGADTGNALGVIRIDLTREPDPINNGENYQLAADPSDSNGEQASDVIIRNGSIYIAESTNRGIYKIDPSSSPAAPAVEKIWTTTTNERSSFQQTMDISADGSVVALLDTKNVRILRFGADGAVTASYTVQPNFIDIDASGRRHIALSEDGNSLFVTFESGRTSGSGVDLNYYSSLEKLDIRELANEADRAAPLRFQTPEQAHDVVVANGMAFVASGLQGLQLVGQQTTDGVDSLALNTYYQTPMAATDIAINSTKKRAYAVGEKSLSIINLTSQDTPAAATNWSQDYVTLVQGGTRNVHPLSAMDVELVNIPDQGMRAVVVQGRDPKTTRFNFVVVDGLGTDTWSTSTIDASSYYKNNDAVKLSMHNGDIYTRILRAGSAGVVRLSNDQITAPSPTLPRFINANTTALTFVGNDKVYADETDLTRYNASTGTRDSSSNKIWNSDLYTMGLTSDFSRIIGVGESSSEGSGCWVFDANGGGSTYSRLVFKTPANSDAHTGGYDQNRQVCFAGYGYQPKLYKASDLNDYRQNVGEFGLMTVAFTTAPEAIDADSNSNSEIWSREITPESVAKQAWYKLPDNPEDVVFKGNRLYVANATLGGIQIIDSSNPLNLILEGVLHTEDSALGVAVTDDEKLVVVADDNMRGIVQIPIEYPTLNRTDNDAVTALLETPEAIAYTDRHELESSVLTYVVDWSPEEYTQVTCYATTDTTPWGNETCTVTPIDGDATSALITWTLPAGDVDQEIRVAVGNNIEFLSTSTQVFVDKKPNVVAPE